MPSSATLQTPFSPQFHNLPLDYFYSATVAPFYSALDSSSIVGTLSLSGAARIDDEPCLMMYRSELFI